MYAYLYVRFRIFMAESAPVLHIHFGVLYNVSKLNAHKLVEQTSVLALS